MEKAAVFERTITEYLRQVEDLADKEKIATTLAVQAATDGFRIPFFHRTYRVGAGGIADTEGRQAPYPVAVILCKYLLLCPARPAADPSLVTYKDFRDAAPLVGTFRQTVERPIAEAFTHGLDRLEARCPAIGGTPYETEVSCQLAYRFNVLPKLPLFLLFNDADEDFPAQATLLFQKDAAAYLDMECLAMVGSAFVRYLGVGER